jgi:hypothetical protein
MAQKEKDAVNLKLAETGRQGRMPPRRPRSFEEDVTNETIPCF